MVPPPLATACLLACSRSGVGAVGVCGVLRLPPACGVTVMGRDNVVPPHTVWRWVALVAPWRGKRKRGRSHDVLTRAHTERGRGGRGGHVGRTVVAWAGVVGGGALGGNARWWRQVPKDGGEQN